VWYVTLAMKGFFPLDELTGFRQIDELLQGHPHNTAIPGVENSGGPLGQGISQACGSALALKIDKKPNHVYCLMGDGELDEGECWEAFMFAGNKQLDNLTVIIDRNNIQIDGPTDTVMPLENLKAKLSSFGFHVLTIDGHNHRSIRSALLKRARGMPVAVIAKTIPGKGVKEFEGKYEWHGKPPSPEQGEQALKELREEHQRIQRRWF
jgi:transketolase